MTTPISQPIANNSAVNTRIQDTLDQLNTPSALSGEGGLGSLDQADFLRLLTTQLANQDPLNPTDNEEMLAQLAQFSQLEAATDSTVVLNEISDKLDALTVAQEAAIAAAQSAADAAARAADAAENAATPQLP
ncbi:MAG: flagellar hook capping FlgD N-terminal domain-containing protein [Pseudomonadota bacterium]